MVESVRPEPNPSLLTGATSGYLVALQRRTLGLLTLGQVLGGLGMGAALSVGALAVSDVVGAAWSGLAATMTTLGAALLAVPLARLADRRGRRISLSTGTLLAALGSGLCFVAVTAANPVGLFLGLGLVGAATAVALQSRFAATDLASAATRGRDLSLVVWSTTIGAVAGPNLVQPGGALGAVLGVPALAGVFAFPVVAQTAAAVAYLIWMRPDPLLESRRVTGANRAKPSGRTTGTSGSPVLVRVAITSVAASHAAMVALMSMTPVHLVHGGATLSVVGFTISLHIAGMFALSPVFGMLADRMGRLPVIALGQAFLLGAVVITALGHQQHGLVMVGLILLGLGWSAATVAGSALLTEAAPAARRVVLQGRTDLIMNLAGALGGAASGLVFAGIGYTGLAWVLLLPVAVALAGLAVGRQQAALEAAA